MAEFKLHIDGMHCGSCVGRVTEALKATPGIKIEEVTIGAAKFSAAAGPAPADLAIAALAKAGYAARLEP